MVTLNALAIAVALTGADAAGTNEAVLLNFTSPHCGPCATMQPTIGRLVRDGYRIQKIDVGQQSEVAARFQVTGVPAFVMLSNGREVDRVVGPCSHARLVEMYAKAQPARHSTPIVRQQPAVRNDVVRAQSPENTTLISTQTNTFNPRRHAFNATVRLRIEDPNGHSVGTGTVVDSHGNEVLAVTCGHIFRDSAGQGRVHVDLFPNGQKRTVQGTLISYDLTRDIGLVSFVPGYAMSPAKIAPAGHRFAQGDAVFSVGCDNGSEPRLRDSRITSIDRYLGPPNIEATGEPAPGRSGGGLFSQDGYLIGICNHGDPRDDEGIYASLPTIHWELDRVGQRRIYEPNADALARQGLSPSRSRSASSEPRRLDATTQAQTRAISPVAQASHTQPVDGQPTNNFGSASPNDTEVVYILRSRTNPQAEERVYVLDQPSADLLDRLASESRPASRDDTLATRHIQTPPSQNNSIRAATAGSPIVRAQSSDRR